MKVLRWHNLRGRETVALEIWGETQRGTLLIEKRTFDFLPRYLLFTLKRISRFRSKQRIQKSIVTLHIIRYIVFRTIVVVQLLDFRLDILCCLVYPDNSRKCLWIVIAACSWPSLPSKPSGTFPGYSYCSGLLKSWISSFFAASMKWLTT